MWPGNPGLGCALENRDGDRDGTGKTGTGGEQQGVGMVGRAQEVGWGMRGWEEMWDVRRDWDVECWEE